MLSDFSISGSSGAGSAGGGRTPALGHAEFPESTQNRLEGATHLRLAESADAADPEGIGDRELARIDDVALLAQAVVEALEVEARIGRRVDRKITRLNSSHVKIS